MVTAVLTRSFDSITAASGNPKPAPSDPDNPLNLSDDTITKLFNTGKAMAILASLII